MNTKYRWLQVIGVLLIAVMALNVLQPASARNSAPAPTVLTTGFTAATDTGSLASLLGTPIKPIRIDSRSGISEGFGTKYDWNSLANRYLELNTNRPIPRGKPSLTGNRPQSDVTSTGRPFIEPNRHHYTDDPMPGLDHFWEGVNQGANRTLFGFGFVPPDTNGDTSGDVATSGYYIQTVNGAFAIWDYSKTTVYGDFPRAVYGPAPTNTLFYGMGGACETTNDGDPIVLYDEQADRWLISQFALPVFDFAVNPYPHDYYQCIAISKTSDPLGGWWQYEYPFDVMNDYPHFGIWGDGYYMTINQFDPFASGSQWRGQGVVVFDRDSMLAGTPVAPATAINMVYFDTYAGCTLGTEDVCFLGGMLPADTEGTPADSSKLNYVIQFDDDAWGYSVDQLQMWSVGVDWTAVTGGGTMTHALDLPVNAFDSEVCAGYARSCIAQPGTTQGVDAIADRLMYRIQYRNFDTADYETMVLNHTVDVSGTGQAGIRWYELRNTAGAGWVVRQQADYAPDTDSRWMGSIAMDKVGNIALGYSVSSATTYPSIRYTGQLASDSLNTMRAENAIANGAGSQTTSAARWGDYSSMSVAPANGCDFVYTQEYIRDTTPANWWTRIGNFANKSCLNNDIVSPDTTILTNPTDPSAVPTADFTFSSPDGTATFECSLDGETFAACTTPQSYTDLASGSHTFQVRAVDTNANIDQTPASYTWMVALPIVVTYNSLGLYDGWVLESTETSNVGGTLNSTATTFQLGDSALKQQFKSILAFDTHSLPDNAIITSVVLKIRQWGSPVGTNPFTALGDLQVDIRKGPFGGANALVAGDFQAPSSAALVSTFNETPVSGWYSATLNSSGQTNINKTGMTQFRLYFSLDDNNNGVADLMKFGSGNNATVKPQLIITYTTP